MKNPQRAVSSHESFCYYSDIVRVPPKDIPKVSSGWIVGFCDAEATFYINVGSSKTTKTGSRVELSFIIKQAKESATALFAIKEFFGAGTIKWDQKSHKYLRYEVKSFTAINSIIIPFFNSEKNTLLTSKRLNFLDFQKVANMVVNREHLSEAGLNQIKTIKAGMNSGRSFQDKLEFMNAIVDQLTITPAWISGFLDGEAYFGIYVTGTPRRRCELRLSIGQNAHDVALLTAIAKYLALAARIVDNLGAKNSNVKRLDIYKLNVLKPNTVRCWREYPLITAKRFDFYRWDTERPPTGVVHHEHLTDEGFNRILKLASKSQQS